MNLIARLQQLGLFRGMTMARLEVSRILFDRRAGRPMFWTSQEGVETLLWNSLIGGPFIFFALMVSAQRTGSGK